MPAHIPAVLLFALVGKIAILQYLHLKVYHEIKQKALDREQTLQLIDKRIAELSDANGVMAHANNAMVEELQKIRSEVEKEIRPPENVVMDHVLRVYESVRETKKDVSVCAGKVFDAAYDRLFVMVGKLQEFADDVFEKLEKERDEKNKK